VLTSRHGDFEFALADRPVSCPLAIDFDDLDWRRGLENDGCATGRFFLSSTGFCTRKV